MKINIFQHGTDGFGHQLYGLFSLLILHGVKDYYFEPYIFINKSFNFDHISEEEKKICKNYMIKIVTDFINKNNLQPISYPKIVYTKNIPQIADHVLYSFDNAYLSNIGLNEIENQLRLENINDVKKYFMNSNIENVFNSEKNIVIHVRCGDALYRYKNKKEYDSTILKIIEKLQLLYPLYKIHIHSDGEAINLQDTIFYNKKTPILDVFSNFIYSDIIVISHSALSMVASFMGEKELVIVPDNLDKYLLPKNVTFSKFLSIE